MGSTGIGVGAGCAESTLVWLASGGGIFVGVGLGAGEGVKVDVSVGAMVGVEVAVAAGSEVKVGVVNSARISVAAGKGVDFELPKGIWLKRQANRARAISNNPRIGFIRSEL